MLRTRRCTTCHAIDGMGGNGAPDLAVRLDEDLSPAALAARMWNHGPQMWKQLADGGRPLIGLNEGDIANFYAYLYSLRHFDPPGDAERGKSLFDDKGCGGCHELMGSKRQQGDPVAGSAVGAPPVEAWATMADPVLWIQSMWNHGSVMSSKMASKQREWPRLELEEMADLLAFVESQPRHEGQIRFLRLGDWSNGRMLFADKGCSGCHTIGEEADGKVDLTAVAHSEPRISGLAVKLWNHRPEMEAKAGGELARFEGDEMSDLLAYLFREGYFELDGSVDRGRAAYEAKGCASCHDKGEVSAPALKGSERAFSSIRMATAVWMHGPAMKVQMDYLEKQWPMLDEADMADLVAFLNSR
jgi:cytochrome c551/c552